MRELVKQQAFTLFEMVVAVAIFAVMGAIAFPGISQLAKTGHALGESNQRISDLQFAVTYFTLDWMQVSNRKVRNRYGSEEPNILIEDNTVTFTRGGRSNLLQQKRSRLQRLRYSLIEGELVREHWQSLDQGIAEEPLKAVLLKNVEDFQVSFIDSAEKKIENWPTVGLVGTGPPIALLFEVELSDFGVIQRVLEVPGGVI
ncbi:MAG: type II secretion system minor pseudopilin GspJ [Gammaproteobacteria bacterium]|nr:type II secretion system minor pseudopilin GspJ [Gammaproteobacteria bacterium]